MPMEALLLPSSIWIGLFLVSVAISILGLLSYKMSILLPFAFIISFATAYFSFITGDVVNGVTVHYAVASILFWLPITLGSIDVLAFIIRLYVEWQSGGEGE